MEGAKHMGRKRRSPEEKAKIALEALPQEQPVQGIRQNYGVHPNMMSAGKRQMLNGAGDIFRMGGSSREKELLKQLGRAQVETAMLEENGGNTVRTNNSRLKRTGWQRLIHASAV